MGKKEIKGMENNNIQKPVSLIVKETKEEIVKLINNTQLHPTLLGMILKEVYAEFQEYEQKYTEQEQAQYYNELKAAEEENSSAENKEEETE